MEKPYKLSQPQMEDRQGANNHVKVVAVVAGAALVAYWWVSGGSDLVLAHVQKYLDMLDGANLW